MNLDHRGRTRECPARAAAAASPARGATRRPIDVIVGVTGMPIHVERLGRHAIELESSHSSRLDPHRAGRTWGSHQEMRDASGDSPTRLVRRDRTCFCWTLR